MRGYSFQKGRWRREKRRKRRRKEGEGGDEEGGEEDEKEEEEKEKENEQKENTDIEKKITYKIHRQCKIIKTADTPQNTTKQPSTPRITTTTQ